MAAKRSASTSSESTAVAESVFTRFVVAPVLFVSFLVSLVLVDRQTSGSVLGKSGGKDGYYHSHQRKLAKQEMDNAFQLRGKVIAGMALLSAMSLALFAWAIEFIWRGWRRT